MVCHTVSRLRDASNIDGEKRGDLHHIFLKLYESGHRRIQEIMVMAEKVDHGL